MARINQDPRFNNAMSQWNPATNQQEEYWRGPAMPDAEGNISQDLHDEGFLSNNPGWQGQSGYGPWMGYEDPKEKDGMFENS